MVRSMRRHGLRTVAVYGGVGYGAQTTALKGGAHIVVGTPGRVLVSFPVYTATKEIFAFSKPEQREFKGFARPIHVAELDPSACAPA